MFVALLTDTSLSATHLGLLVYHFTSFKSYRCINEFQQQFLYSFAVLFLLAFTLPNSTSSLGSLKQLTRCNDLHSTKKQQKPLVFYLMFWSWSLICPVSFSVNSEAFLHRDLSKANVEINELSRDQTNLCSSPVKAPVITLFT